MAVQDSWNTKYKKEGFESNITEQIGSFCKDSFTPKVIQVIEKYLDINDKILEVGCGTGRLLISLLLRNKRERIKGFGVDFSEESVRLSQELSTKFKVNPEIKKADILNLPYGDDFFDLVFMDSVLEHIPKYEKVLKELSRITKPGKYIVATVPNKLRFDGWDLYKYLYQLEYFQTSFTPWFFKNLFWRNSIEVVETFGDSLWLGKNFRLLMNRYKKPKMQGQRILSDSIQKHQTPFKDSLGTVIRGAGKRLKKTLPWFFYINIGIVGKKHF